MLVNTFLRSIQQRLSRFFLHSSIQSLLYAFSCFSDIRAQISKSPITCKKRRDFFSSHSNFVYFYSLVFFIKL